MMKKEGSTKIVNFLTPELMYREAQTEIWLGL